MLVVDVEIRDWELSILLLAAFYDLYNILCFLQFPIKFNRNVLNLYNV